MKWNSNRALYFQIILFTNGIYLKDYYGTIHWKRKIILSDSEPMHLKTKQPTTLELNSCVFFFTKRLLKYSKQRISLSDCTGYHNLIIWQPSTISAHFKMALLYSYLMTFPCGVTSLRLHKAVSAIWYITPSKIESENEERQMCEMSELVISS